MVLKRDSMSAINRAATDTISRMVTWYTTLPTLAASELPENRVVFLVIDAINGFATEGGTLYDRRVEGMIPNIAELLKKFPSSEKFFFCDSHDKNSLEFNSYPAHAIDGEWESLVVDELKEFTKFASIVKKNSTNAMLAPMGNPFNPFLKYIYDEYAGAMDSDLPTFVIIGDVTDICVMQAALTLKASFNQWSLPARIVVPANCVETFDLAETNHDGDVMNLFALYNMNMNGVEVVADIK